jgi:hypothetical protein
MSLNACSCDASDVPLVRGLLRDTVFERDASADRRLARTINLKRLEPVDEVAGALSDRRLASQSQAIPSHFVQYRCADSH